MGLLTSFEGRIRRRSFWLGLLAIIIINAALAFLVVPALLLLLGPAVGYWLAVLVVYAASAFLYAALATKRLHDRSKPAMPWVGIFVGVPLAVTLAQFLGIGFETVVVPAAEATGALNARPVPDSGGMVEISRPDGALGLVLLALAVAVSLWALVELGFRRGTDGPNRFGPDPKSPDPAAREA